MSTESDASSRVVLAAVAHPDDIEFMMAGTLLLLKDMGWEVHFWNLANGSCGSMEHSASAIVKIRAEEAEASARMMGACCHPPLFDDLAVFYDKPSLASVAAVIRKVNPSMVLTHAPSDYMEDHQNVCRLVVSAAFVKGVPNFVTAPETPAIQGPVRVYHALPHGLRDGLARVVVPDLFVDTGSVIEKKKELLSCHRSQKSWLDATQGMGAYLEEMERLGREAGALSKSFALSEGFLRHSHLGFCPPDFDPLPLALAGRVATCDTP